MQPKIHKKLLDLAEQLGRDDHSVSVHDYHEGYDSQSETIAVGNTLVELIDKESFIGCIMEMPDLMESYIQGYVSAIDFEDDLPEDINEGNVCEISVHLTDEQQNRIRELVKKNLQEN